ncbi:xanthine dehydrogenase family protein molybdopterin-binding subunit [Petrocella sp. FN5]|uniref:xanthine dehydrogenase family protein molybdopterin-binding subunit n=1 Tax=Petrocella sp. FN5 TaxID=3032002 RepID=UPI0023DADD02|nr:molybdopterin cofactor-binding domain-containing protein [Petrocella sp. FN5]MDF1616059.1 molybdopterin-dependent oxidoreductase [Petrocella sp. FN5]
MKCVNHNTGSIDGKGLMLGRSAYTNDLADPNALTVKVLRSPHPHAKIRNIDIRKALLLEGVECVLTYKDFKRIPVTRAGQGYPEPSPHDKFVLDSVVRYVGDDVAIVAAETEAIASRALELIHVDYEILEPILDFEKAYENESIIHPEPEIHEMFPIGFEPQKNVAASYHMEIGSVDEILKHCDVTVSTSHYTQAQAHVMMEPHTANARLDFQDRLVIYSSTQTPFHARRIVSQALEIPMSRIRVIKPRIGGGFGGKQCLHGEFFVAAVTLKTKKPCKLVYTRKEVFESSYSRHPMRIDVTLGSTKDGKLKALDVKVLSDTGAYGEHALTVFMVAGAKTLPLYNKVEAVRFGGRVVYTNHTPGGAFRGYGAIQGNFAVESAVDQLCEKLGMDPIKFRQNNMIAEGETSPVFAKMGEGTEGTAMNMDSCKLDYCVNRGMELIGWKDKYPRKTISKTKVRSVGMCLAMQGSGIPYIDMGSAIIKLNDTGFYNLMVGATDIGQGSDTILAQIAAESLKTTIDKIIVYSSDSDLTPFDTGAYASSTTYVSGNAVKKAADQMLEMIVEEGAKALKVRPEDIHFDGDVLTVKETDTSMTLESLSNRLFYNEDQKQLVATHSYVGTKSPPPFMAGFAEVEVDLETGAFKVLDYVAVVDCGTTINPSLAKVQVEGGILQGLGMAMFEEVIYNKNGSLITNNLMNYRIPTRKEVTNIRVEFADSYEASGPYGAKSVGEIGIDTPPAVIANAIYNAIGVRINSLPITSEKVWAAIHSKEI